MAEIDVAPGGGAGVIPMVNRSVETPVVKCGEDPIVDDSV